MRTIEIPEDAKQFPLAWRDANCYVPDGDTRVLLWLCGQTTGSIVEIGCNLGFTSARIATCYPHKRLIGVDCSTPTMVAQQMHEAISANEIGKVAADVPNCTFFDVDSRQFNYGESAPDATLVFIDGDHSFQGVKADTENALRFLRSRSGRRFVVWHDYHPEPKIAWVNVGAYLREHERQIGEIVHVARTAIAYSEVP